MRVLCRLAARAQRADSRHLFQRGRLVLMSILRYFGT